MVRRIGLIALVAITMVCLPVLLARSPRQDTPNVLERFSVAKDGEPLLVPVDVGYNRYLFMLGTGSAMSVYEGTFRLGNPTQVISPEESGEKKELTLFNAPDSKLGKLPIHNGKTPVHAVNFTNARYVCGRPIYGILGRDFFERYVVQVDFDEGELRILKKATEDCGQAINLRMQGRQPGLPLPFAAVKVGGTEEQMFLISTSSIDPCGVYFNHDLFDSLVEKGQIKVEQQVEIQNGGEDIKARVGSGVSLSLGENLVKAPYVCEGKYNVLGLGFLARFVVTFDLANATIYLKKGKSIDRPDTIDQSGLHILRIDGNTLVAKVDEGSPAAAKGVRVGDQISKVGTEAVQNISLFRLRRMLAEPGQTVTLTIWREFEEKQVELTAK